MVATYPLNLNTSFVGSSINSSLNSNFAKIQDALNSNVLHRTGNGPKSMVNDLDMNSHDILNVDIIRSKDGSNFTSELVVAAMIKVLEDTLFDEVDGLMQIINGVSSKASNIDYKYRDITNDLRSDLTELTNQFNSHADDKYESLTQSINQVSQTLNSLKNSIIDDFQQLRTKDSQIEAKLKKEFDFVLQKVTDWRGYLEAAILNMGIDVSQNFVEADEKIRAEVASLALSLLDQEILLTGSLDYLSGYIDLYRDLNASRDPIELLEDQDLGELHPSGTGHFSNEDFVVTKIYDLSLYESTIDLNS